MAFIPFKKSNKCLVTDDLFIEITWEEGKSPEEDSELLGIIEGLDQQYLDTFQHPIEESLPYVTFRQAELLFQALQDAYGQLQLNKVAICHLEGKEAVSEGEVFANPFVIDGNYQNLLLPLIQAILTDPEFQSYTYTEKREYFVNQIYPAYKISLGIQESSLPLFPVEGEQVITASPMQKQVSKMSVSPTQSVVAPSTKESSLKKVYILLGLLGVLAAGGIVSSMMAFSQLSKQSEQVTYLYQELKDTNSLIDKEHQVDVFNRYFLPTYYSGNKEALSEYLSDGDAKYTAPKEGTLQSVILEKMTYDSKTKEYTSTYVLSVKHDDKPSNVRLTFKVKATDSKKGFVVTTEPKESDYNK
ncbi:hypothetical protein ACFKI6_01270 [Streptococcus agalactiae]|uniref:hypothetical protein n=1 Tax=Streptococcus TaxID=1301 RepID=UPI00137506EA|nr:MULTISPECIES: hypothetical protein [Streptococcus]KAF1103115.1 hypothetical protein B8U81_03090 [Streptococcus agalactiae]WFM79050.1 hypothetical protein P7F70_05805 [Streptococcus pluranimalium]